MRLRMFAAGLALVWFARSATVVTSVRAEQPIRTLVVTGYNHPAHDWRATTPVVLRALANDGRFDVRLVEDPLFLESSGLSAYQVVVLNFADFQRPSPGPLAEKCLRQFVEQGGGLFVLHFASGAWDDSTTYQDLAGRVWRDGQSGHDAYGALHVEIVRPEHPAVAGLAPFDTTDEPYFGLAGQQPVEVLCTARSRVTGRDEPLVFVFELGKGRVFHTTLGHDVAALSTAGPQALLVRGCAWAAGRAPAP